ncbi:hypothetical protein MYO4S_00280 [Serratia phage 4S]|nr:hypothetical protein MYO4S_00280 [Serratia phage 4S]
MIINKNSISYRWMKFWDLKIPTSLCPYVRKLVFSIMAVIGTIAAIIIFFTGLGSIFIIPKGAVLTFGLLAASFGTGVAMTVAMTVAGGATMYFTDKWLTKRKAKMEEYDAKVASGEIVPKSPGLIKTYWKSLHDKMCPMIEFK